ncbi:hypothetical protein FQ142_00015 [Microbacterium sp. ANT_H45B]|nr:hypothetical protein FQ142_00015 [Microbacterium sp. ANT_H45B]
MFRSLRLLTDRWYKADWNSHRSVSYGSLQLRHRAALFLLFLGAWTLGLTISLRWMATLPSPLAWGTLAGALLITFSIATLGLSKPFSRVDGANRATLCLCLVVISILTVVVSYSFVLVFFPVMLIMLIELPRRSALIVSGFLIALGTILYWPYWAWAPPLLPVVTALIVVLTILLADATITTTRRSRDRLMRVLQDLRVANQRVTDSEAQAAVALERIRIAADIHDSIAQQSLALLMLHKRYRETGSPDEQLLRTLITESELLTTQTLQDARRLVRELGTAGPPRTTISDMTSEMHETCTLFERRAELLGIPLTWTVSVCAEAGELDSEESSVLLRGLHVLLSNVMYHAEATSVSVMFTLVHGQPTLVVQDDGVGIRSDSSLAPTRIESTGSGLQLLRARLRTVGADLAVNSEVGAGTTATIHLQSRVLDEPAS